MREPSGGFVVPWPIWVTIVFFRWLFKGVGSGKTLDMARDMGYPKLIILYALVFLLGVYIYEVATGWENIDGPKQPVHIVKQPT